MSGQRFHATHYGQRAHTPIYRARTGIECERCAMRPAWVGWKDKCSAPMTLDPARHERARLRRYSPRTS